MANSAFGEIFHSRRAHNKSRHGCKSCKARRVKERIPWCDEKKPTCTSCSVREMHCEYSLSNSGRAWSDNRLLMTIGRNTKSQLDIELMHHYTTATVSSLNSILSLTEPVVKLLSVDVPKLAFQHEFLLDNLLLFALIHMKSANTSAGDLLAITIYREKALASFRHAITKMAPKDTQAVLLTSFLLAITSLPTDRVLQEPHLWTVNWLHLTSGPQSLLGQMKRSNLNASIGSISRDQVVGDFVDHPIPAGIPMGLRAALSQMSNFHDSSAAQVLLQAALRTGKLFGALTLPDTTGRIGFKVRSWPFLLPSEFTNLVMQHNPCALLIVAYYLPFLQFLADGWLFEGIAAQEMRKIAQALDSDWAGYLVVPQKALEFTKESDLKAFLVSQMPSDSLHGLITYEPFFAPRHP